MEIMTWNDKTQVCEMDETIFRWLPGLMQWSVWSKERSFALPLNALEAEGSFYSLILSISYLNTIMASSASNKPVKLEEVSILIFSTASCCLSLVQSYPGLHILQNEKNKQIRLLWGQFMVHLKWNVTFFNLAIWLTKPKLI
jgi:hypothetical protein